MCAVTDTVQTHTQYDAITYTQRETLTMVLLLTLVVFCTLFLFHHF